MTRRAYVLAAILAILAACFAWSLRPSAPRISTAAYLPAHVPAELAREPRETITTKAQVYRDKHRAMGRLGMDEADSEDDAEELATAAAIPPTPAGAKAVVFLNTTTGRFRTVVKANPLPFFSVERGTELGVRYGVTTRGGRQAVDLFVRRDLVRLGRVYVSGYVEGSGEIGGGVIRPREAKAMIEASGRFYNLPGLE